MVKLLKVALASYDAGCPGCAGNQNTASGNQDPNRSITYDEGDGKKDLVVMTGPLSHVYTQALNVYFAKTDVNESDTKQEVSDSASVATESAQIDTVILTALKDKLKQNEASPLDAYNIVSDRDDIDDNPNVVVFTTDAASATNPEVVAAAEIENTRFEDTEKDWIMFIGPDPSNDGKIGTVFVEPGSEEELNAFNVAEQFKRATESFYASRGIKVVFGFENLLETLLNRSKGK